MKFIHSTRKNGEWKNGYIRKEKRNYPIVTRQSQMFKKTKQQLTKQLKLKENTDKLKTVPRLAGPWSGHSPTW